MTDDNREEGEHLSSGEPEAPLIERGATLEGDEDAIAAAANTSLDMDGFETGAGFDLENLPEDLDLDLDVELLEVRSSADEMDLDVPEITSPVEVGGADAELPLLPDDDAPPAMPAHTAPPVAPADTAPPVMPDDAAPPEVPADAGPLAVPTDAAPPATPTDAGTTAVPADAAPPASPATKSGGAGKKAKLSGLQRLERQKRLSAGRRVVMAALALLLLGAGGAIVLGYLGVLRIPGITPAERVVFAVAAPIVLPGPQPETPVMSHVVVVDVWQEAETPLVWADALREGAPDLLGFVTAVTVDRERQYALMVGPAYSAEEANDLKGPLEMAFALLNPDPESWTVREAPYSFFFGEYAGLGPANARVRQLTDRSVPTFVLRVDYLEGAPKFRVYGGAFSDELEAAEMGQLLGEQELGGTLMTERRGQLPR
ncbi:MAG: hypothetical protein IID07_10940 [Gemmatimonadetes bacterium]|nr:hypothetical protein [Gemmatimonadota bacterium]